MSETKKIQRLKEDIARLATVAQKIKDRVGRHEAEPDEALLEAIAFQLQAFYTGTEFFFEKALTIEGIKIAKEHNSHVQILDAAQNANLIPKGQYDYMRDLTRFRHYARHGYGFTLEADLLVPKAKQLPDFWKELEKIAKSFIKNRERRASGNEGRTNRPSASPDPGNIT